MGSEEQKSYLFPSEQFSGKMVVDRDGLRYRFDLAMTVSVDDSGQLMLDTELISAPINKLLVLKCLLGKGGGSCHEFKFCCRSSDGKRLVSDRAYLTSCHDRVRNANASVRVTIRTNRARLSMNAGEISNTPVLKFHLPNFLCVSPIILQTEAGQVGIIGASKLAEHSQITGAMSVEAPAGSDYQRWRPTAYRLLERLHLVLAFARGAPLPIPIEECFKGKFEKLTFNGSDHKFHSDMMPPLEHLLLESFVSSVMPAVEKMAKERWNTLSTGIGGWLISSEYHEVGLLTAITALESIMHNFLKAKILKGKKCKCHPNHKQPPLACRINMMLSEMEISRKDIEADKIKEPATLRNKIVHRSHTPKKEKEDDEIWEAILLSREVLVRVVFSMLGFKGTYFCYLGGRHRRAFPACQRIDCRD